MESSLSDDDLRRVYAETGTIAVVGASTTAGTPAHRIPAYLLRQGYRIVPVNPTAAEVLGERAYASLRDVEVPVDVVDVFRPAGEAPAIAADAVAIGARVLWLQQGIVSAEAARIARDGGLEVVMDLCMGATHARLGLGPGPGRD